VTAYHPHNLSAVIVAFAGLFAVGLLITRLRPAAGRLFAWLLVVAAVGLVDRLTTAEPPGVRMVAIAAGLLIAAKAVVTVEAQADGVPPLTAWRWLLFTGLSVDMRPELFRTVGGPPRSGVARLLGRAAGHAAIGLCLLWIARELQRTTAGDSLVAAAALLVGIGLVFHYGFLTLVAAGWRLVGVPADELHRRPTAARSLTEFWGRRWNLPFAAFTARAVFRPVRRLFGDGVALFAAFALSGVLHEAAISLPVRAGFGGPLAYFLLHGGLVLAERVLRPERWGVIGRVWTAAWLVGPLPLLFHQPFLNSVVWPLVGVG
jgi:Membrane bound O-acyl transferase family